MSLDDFKQYFSTIFDDFRSTKVEDPDSYCQNGNMNLDDQLNSQISFFLAFCVVIRCWCIARCKLFNMLNCSTYTIILKTIYRVAFEDSDRDVNNWITQV